MARAPLVDELNARLSKSLPAFVVTDPAFGAVGDGVTDDSAAIDAACRAAAAVHGAVIFPATVAGLYRMTQPLYLDPYVTYAFDTCNAVTIVTSATTAIRARTRGTAATNYVTLLNPSVQYAGTARAAGTIAIDLTDCSHVQLRRPSMTAWDVGIAGQDSGVGAGYYNQVEAINCTSCNIGLDLGYSANSWKVQGGRVYSCVTAGARLASCNNVELSTAFESNAVGVWLRAGTVDNVVTSCRFEGNATNGILVDAGAGKNYGHGNHYSNGTDAARDASGLFFDTSGGAFGLGAPLSGIGGRNLLVGGGCDVDTNSDGLADGWSVSPSIPAGLTAALDTAQRTGGAGAAQRFTIDAAGTSQRAPALTVAVEPGVPHVFSGWVRVSSAGAWAVKIGDTLADNNYMLWLVDTPTTWLYMRQPFTPTGSSVQVYLYMRDFAAGAQRQVWVDELQLQRGSIPTGFQG